MGLFDGIELFVLTVDAGSFAAASRRVGLTPSAVSRRVAQLEEDVGSTLLVRTTRTLRLTDDGRAFHERCVRAVDELREARDGLARASRAPRGRLRVDVALALGRAVIGPALPRFLERHPDVRVDLTLRDQLVDPVAEGIDVLVRIGKLADSSLIARRLGESRIVHVASPAYVARHGAPRHPDDLVEHACLGYLREGFPSPFAFVENGSVATREVAGPFHVNDADVLRQMAVAGKGIVALFDFLARDLVAEKKLVLVLGDHPGTTWPIHALYPKNRHLLPKVTAFLDFLSSLFAEGTSTRRSQAKARKRA